MMLLSFLSSSGRTHESLPCGLQWRILVELFEKQNSKFYWYDFTVRGQRYRGSTKQTPALRFPGSPANGNSALRTLSRMLSKAKEWKLLRYLPEFKLFKETGRTLKLDDEAERRLLPHAEQPLRDI